jgi:hypothetical protein
MGTAIRFHVEPGDRKLNVVHREINLDLLSRIESREAWNSAPERQSAPSNPRGEMKKSRLERTHPCTDNSRIETRPPGSSSHNCSSPSARPWPPWPISPSPRERPHSPPHLRSHPATRPWPSRSASPHLPPRPGRTCSPCTPSFAAALRPWVVRMPRDALCPRPSASSPHRSCPHAGVRGPRWPSWRPRCDGEGQLK